MLSLRKSIILALGLSINTTMAQDSIDTSAVYTQGEQPLIVAKRRDSRQRGECGISPNPWALNLCESNTFCYVAPEEVSLWLPESQRPTGTVQAVIENTLTGATKRVRWGASAPTLAWPVAKMPISDGAVFSIKLKKRRFTKFNKEIVLYKIPADRQTHADRADWMDQKGCTSQAEMLLEEQTT